MSNEFYSDLSHITALLSRFLTRYNIRGKENVGIILLTESDQTRYEIERAITCERDAMSPVHRRDPRFDFEVNGRPIAVRSPKPAITL